MDRIVTRVIILNEKNEVLLGKRVGGNNSGKWALIGGKPDKNETTSETIIREVNEEIGVKLINHKLFKEEIDNESVPGESWKVSYFYGTIVGNLKLKLDEITDAVYVSYKDLDKYEIAYNHERVLREFFCRKG